jgi:hypothetical protein
MVLTPQLKDADLLNGLKNKIQLSAISKNLSSLAKTCRLKIK